MSQQIKKKFLDPQLIQEVEDVISNLATESQIRQADIDSLQSQLDFIKNNTDPAALDSLVEIVTAFQQADDNLDSAITNLSAAKDAQIQQVQDNLDTETTARTAADTGLSDRLDVLETDPVTKTYVDGEAQRLDGDIAAETTARQAADTTLSGRLDVLETDPVTKTYVDGEVQRIDGELATETTARQDADTTLSGRLDVLETDPVTKTYVDGEVQRIEGELASEITAREAAVTDLQGQLNFISSNTDPEAIDSLTEVVTAFQQADSNLNSAITNLSASKDAQIQQVQDNLDAEATTRAAADTTLSGRLDVLETDPVTKTYVDGEVQRIDGELAAEVTARADADTALSDRLDVLELDPVTATYVDGEVQRIDGEIAAEITARQAADTALDASLTADIATAKAEAIAYTDSEIAGIDQTHFFAFPTAVDFPATGLEDKLYLSESDSVLHRFVVTQEAGDTFDWVVGPDPEDDFATLEAAVSGAADGDKIQVKAGTYALTSELHVDKELLFFGVDKATTIVQGDFSTATNSTLVRVSANNVLFKGMTFKQLAAATNFCITGQTTDPARPGDQVKIENFAMVDCEVEYPKHGVEIRGANTLIRDVTFTLIAGASSTRYPLMFSHSEGLAFISGCHFNHPFDLTANNRIIYLRGSGTVDSDSSYTGKIYIENNTVEGFVSQFINHDNLNGSNLEVYLLNNDTRAVTDVCSGDTNAFFVAVGSSPDIYTKVVCEDNKFENRHNSEGLGKGMFYLATDARTSPLPVFARNNELANLDLRDTVATGENSPPALFTVNSSLDYTALGLNPYDFSSDFSGLTLEDTPEGPSAFSEAQGEYSQVSAAPVYHTMKVVLDEAGLISIDLDHLIIPESLTLAVGRAMAHLDEDFEITEVGGVSRLTWIGSLQVGGDEEVEVGDTVFATYAYMA